MILKVFLVWGFVRIITRILLSTFCRYCTCTKLDSNNFTFYDVWSEKQKSGNCYPKAVKNGLQKSRQKSQERVKMGIGRGCDFTDVSSLRACRMCYHCIFNVRLDQRDGICSSQFGQPPRQQAPLNSRGIGSGSFGVSQLG